MIDRFRVAKLRLPNENAAPANGRPPVTLTAAMVAASTFLFGAGIASGQEAKPEMQGPVVVANWGGLTNEAYEKFYVGPYTQETGTEVSQVAAPDLFVSRAQAQAQANRMKWGMLDASSGPDTARIIEQLGDENVTDYGYYSGKSVMLIVCH